MMQEVGPETLNDKDSDLWGVGVIPAIGSTALQGVAPSPAGLPLLCFSAAGQPSLGKTPRTRHRDWNHCCPRPATPTIIVRTVIQAWINVSGSAGTTSAIIESLQTYRESLPGRREVAASVRSVNVDNVKRLVDAVRIADGFDMDKILRAASDIGGYAPETNARYEPDGREEASADIERFEWTARWLGLKEPEAEILFNLSGQPYTPSDITREHLLAVLEAICDGEPVDREIWARNDPERNR